MTSLLPKLCILINFFAIKIYLCQVYDVVDHCQSIHRSKRIFSLHFCYTRSHRAKNLSTNCTQFVYGCKISCARYTLRQCEMNVIAKQLILFLPVFSLTEDSLVPLQIFIICENLKKVFVNDDDRNTHLKSVTGMSESYVASTFVLKYMVL